MKKIYTLLLFVGLFLSSCTEEIDQSITLDLSDYSLIRNGEQVEVQYEAKCIMEVGSQITIVLIGETGENTAKWESTSPEIANVELDKITALKAGDTKIIDRNNSKRVISIHVQ